MALAFELPARRIAFVEKASHNGHRFHVHCGFDPHGAVREIFVSAKRETTDLVEFITDASILISKQLQSGARLADLAVHAPDGLLGTVIAVAIAIERDCADAVRETYARRAA